MAGGGHAIVWRSGRRRGNDKGSTGFLDGGESSRSTWGSGGGCGSRMLFQVIQGAAAQVDRGGAIAVREGTLPHIRLAGHDAATAKERHD